VLHYTLEIYDNFPLVNVVVECDKVIWQPSKILIGLSFMAVSNTSLVSDKSCVV